MLSLPSDLDTLSFSLFMRCDEFNNVEALRAVFSTHDLFPFRDNLPVFSDKKTFVLEVKLLLLSKVLADGRELMLPFLATLRGLYPEQEALRGELNRLHQRMLAQHALNRHYICYTPGEGNEYAERLHTALQQAGARPWLERHDAPDSDDPEAVREDALRGCASVLLVLTPTSANVQSDSIGGEWRRALRFKRPIVPLRFVSGVDLPQMLGNRTVLDFTGPFEPALSDLRRSLNALNTPAGQLHELEYRLADAERELRDAPDDPRILHDITQLQTQIEDKRAVARDPQAAARAAEQRTQAAIEREREPARPVAGRTQTKFINPPPLTAPPYFQDRHNENKLIAEFLCEPARRLLTVVGRGGVGKTAMVCRLLKALEGGSLPDDLGEFRVRGIVYLSAMGSHRISFPNLHADLLRLLPADRVQSLAKVYQDPHKSVVKRFTPVLETFVEVADVPVVVLLDNMEDLLDPTTNTVTDAEVDAALRALLEAPPHPVKVLLTTRMAPREILLLRPERQMTVPLDEGLPSPYAERILRAGDPTGVLGLKDATDERLAPACAFTRGYPRALEALAAALNADRATSLDDLLAGPPPANVVEALVGQAYSRLDPAAQTVMQGLGIFGRPVPPAAVDYLLQPHLPGLDSTPILNRLVNMRFVTKEGSRYYMHPVDREYALQRLTLEPSISHLQTRAADYFREIRTPRADWWTLADLAPQLGEIDLRYAAGDYNTAAQVLSDIGYDYLLMWGHYRLMIDQHERLQGKLSGEEKRASVHDLGSAYYVIGQTAKARICYEQAVAEAREAKDKWAEASGLGGLANCFHDVGQIHNAIKVFEQGLAIFREIESRPGEALDLGNLGICYADLGQTRRAIETLEQTLIIDREVGNKYGEGIDLASLAQSLIDENNYLEAIRHAQESVKIGEEIRNPQIGTDGNYSLALAYLYSGNLVAARATIERARQYDFPINKHRVLALLGIIALRRNDLYDAREAFTAALTHAESLLAHTPEFFDVLYAKVLALAGLGEIEDAQAAYQAARILTNAPGVVQRAARLLNQLEGVPKFWE